MGIGFSFFRIKYERKDKTLIIIPIPPPKIIFISPPGRLDSLQNLINHPFVSLRVFYPKNRNGSEKTPAIFCNGRDEPCAAVRWRRGSCIQSDTVAVGCMIGKYIKEIAI